MDDPILTKKLIGLRTNYKFINAYVCGQNKLYPSSENIFDEKAVEIFSFNESNEQDLPTDTNHFEKIRGFIIPQFYNRIKVRISFLVKFDSQDKEKLPLVLTSILSATNKKSLLSTQKDVKEFIIPDLKCEGWFSFSNEDLYPMQSFPDPNGHIFRIEFLNNYEIKMKIKNLAIKFLGIE